MHFQKPLYLSLQSALLYALSGSLRSHLPAAPHPSIYALAAFSLLISLSDLSSILRLSAPGVVPGYMPACRPAAPALSRGVTLCILSFSCRIVVPTCIIFSICTAFGTPFKTSINLGNPTQVTNALVLPTTMHRAWSWYSHPSPQSAIGRSLAGADEII